jgi:endoglucanase
MKYILFAVFSIAFFACSSEGGGVVSPEPSSSSAGSDDSSSSNGSAVAQDYSRARLVNNLLGRGMNFGNAFDAQCRDGNSCNTYSSDLTVPERGNGTWDGCWSNTIKQEYFDIVKTAGFKSVRLPVRWAEKAADSPPFAIPAAFTAEVKKVVDWSIAEGMPIIINIHHYNELYDDDRCRNDLDLQREKFVELWRQIADEFKDYSNDSLIFEVLNEPRNRITSPILNQMLQDVWPVMREKNPGRTIMINSVSWGAYSSLPSIDIPGNDPNVILSGHYYNPHLYTHQGEGSNPVGVNWGTQLEQNKLKEEMESTYARIKAKWPATDGGTIPVNIGEFGVSNRAAIEGRAAWVALLRSEMEMRDMSWHYWGFPTAGAFQACENRTCEDNAWIPEILRALIPEEN